jgi:hypothetical protein
MKSATSIESSKPRRGAQGFREAAERSREADDPLSSPRFYHASMAHRDAGRPDDDGPQSRIRFAFGNPQSQVASYGLRLVSPRFTSAIRSTSTPDPASSRKTGEA